MKSRITPCSGPSCALRRDRSGLIGLGGAAICSRLMRSLLFGVEPLDPLALVISPLAIAAVAILVVSLSASAATFGWLWRRAARDVPALAAFFAIVAAVLAWLLWLAGRDLLPPGTGPDLTHHLLLIGYIEQHWRLPHDPQLGTYLGEMVDYTPGMHLLAALAGAWTRTDRLHAVYPLVAFTV